MHCPVCGAEVVEQAVYCHKCGERLDTQGQPPDSGGSLRTAAGSGPLGAEHGSARFTTSAEKLQRGAGAFQPETEEPERELWQGGYGARAMLGGWALTGLASVLLLAIGIWWTALHNTTAWVVILVIILLLWLYQLLVLAHRRVSVSYQLTTQRLIHVSGILRRVTDRIEMIDIDDVTVEQRLLERLAGVGTIRIASSDRSHPVLLLPGIENVNEVANLIDEARRAERRRRGLHIEQI